MERTHPSPTSNRPWSNALSIVAPAQQQVQARICQRASERAFAERVHAECGVPPSLFPMQSFSCPRPAASLLPLRHPSRPPSCHLPRAAVRRVALVRARAVPVRAVSTPAPPRRSPIPCTPPLCTALPRASPVGPTLAASPPVCLASSPRAP
ncbi:hypothetical protein DENSPDRAFT_885867 [Dentipellis sp. KUC8613]|nr:hypothetical protein DENSPDRAFT_885867 [Dentipellis sp. KUC8613]